MKTIACSLLLLAFAGCFTANGQTPAKGAATKAVRKDTALYVKPAFPGGDDSLQRFLGRNIRYPYQAREAKIQGTVILSFLVNEQGLAEDIRVLRPLPGGCSEEAVRIVLHMPRWKPATYKKRPVSVLYQLPIKFKIEG